MQGSITPPVHRKDKGLGRILLAVILVPIVIIIILVMLFSASADSGVAMNTTYFEKEQYIEARCAGDIEKLIRQCDENGDEVCALRFEDDDVLPISCICQVKRTWGSIRRQAAACLAPDSRLPLMTAKVNIICAQYPCIRKIIPASRYTAEISA